MILDFSDEPSNRYHMLVALRLVIRARDSVTSPWFIWLMCHLRWQTTCDLCVISYWFMSNSSGRCLKWICWSWAVGADRSIQNWAHSSVSQCSSYCGVFQPWPAVGLLQRSTVVCTVYSALSYLRPLGSFPVAFPSACVTEGAGSVVMSPCEPSVCVVPFALLVLCPEPSSLCPNLCYWVCLVVHSSTAVGSPALPSSPRLSLILQTWVDVTLNDPP